VTVGILKTKIRYCESSVISINYCSIIINTRYNHILTYNKCLLKKRDKEQLAVSGLLPLPVSEADCKTLCPMSPPDQRPNDKYPVNTSYRSDLCKNASLQCYLVATVILIPSVRCQICVCIYTCAQYGDAGVAKRKLGQQ